MDTILLYSVPAIAILGLVIMAIQGAWVRKQDAGESKMAEIAQHIHEGALAFLNACLLYTSPSPRDGLLSRMPSSA